MIAVKSNIYSKRHSEFEFEFDQEDIWLSIDHTNNKKTFLNVKYINCNSKLDVYDQHMKKINEIVNGAEPNSNFILCGDYNLQDSISWIRPNINESVCVATNIDGEKAHSVVDMQYLTKISINLIISKISTIVL